ncbi:hypothetical protein V8C34DRAFT_318039 [Trichoderma compactum]
MIGIERLLGLASLEALPREHRHPGLDPWTWTLAMKSEAQKWTEPKSRFSPNLDPSFNSAHGRPGSAAQARTYPSPSPSPHPHPTSNIQERAVGCINMDVSRPIGLPTAIATLIQLSAARSPILPGLGMPASRTLFEMTTCSWQTCLPCAACSTCSQTPTSSSDGAEAAPSCHATNCKIRGRWRGSCLILRIAGGLSTCFSPQ